MPQQVRGVVARSKGAPVTVETIVIPDPGPGEAVVKVQASDAAAKATCRDTAAASNGVERLKRTRTGHNHWSEAVDSISCPRTPCSSFSTDGVNSRSPSDQLRQIINHPDLR